MSHPRRYIGCAGWKLAREYGAAFDSEGSHLQRYASRLNAVEINSSFYRPHRPATYAKWAASVADDFRFSVKVPKVITHEHRLRDCSQLLDAFLSECTALGSKLGCLLVQLPPSFAFDSALVRDFFQQVKARYSGPLVIEPRHESWVQADPLLIDHHVARVAVDPSRITGDDTPHGWPGIRYWRLHGTPRIYYSAYESAWLERLAEKLTEGEREVPTWCIFDNTARDAALGNALYTQGLLQGIVAEGE